MKKLLSAVLSLALLGGLAVPAMAEEAPSADQRLTAVTETVKARLGLDTSAYDSFRGSLQEGSVNPVWHLFWSGGDGRELSLSCTEDGDVLDYYAYSDEGRSDSRNFSPAFPALKRSEARETALAFLEKALGEHQTAAIEEDGGQAGLSEESYSFSGRVLINGLPSPFRFSITVGTAENAVGNFYLMGGAYTQYLKGEPSAVPGTEKSDAAGMLQSTLALRLEYVRDGGEAVLRYLPEDGREYYVDARTGALVDLTALYEQVRDRGLAANAAGGASLAMDSAAPAEAARDSLSGAEKAGVEQMEGVLDKAVLDAAARKITALGLADYAFGAASYSVDRETGDVSARLQYAKQDGDGIARRYVTLDGKTGLLLAVSSSGGWTDEAGSVKKAEAQTAAEGFLKEICGGDFAKTALYESSADGERVHSFTYAQKENGYFFPENSLRVDVDSRDGSVSRYSRSFEEVSFQSAGGIVDMDAALAAWAGTYETVLRYLGVPQKLDPAAPEYRPLIDMGQGYLYALTLSYVLEREEEFLGVDAKTGAPVPGPRREDGGVVYSDIDGNWAETELNALAEYGVGWLGGKAEPGKALTQLDMVALLVSTRYGAADLEEVPADDLYRRAYSLGILPKADRDDGRVLTRMETVKLLLDGAGFGEAAALRDIYRVDFADEADISQEWLGYAALGQGLGVVKGDRQGNLNPNRPATRAEAAVMLCHFMAR